MIGILRLLEDKPQKATHISQKLNINPSVFSEMVNFLLRQNLIAAKKISPKRQVFVLTKRGRTVVSYYRNIQEVMLVEEYEEKPMPMAEIRRRRR